MGKEKKKGKTGIASNYITRTRAVRKLQISLKDFRRLCILKGIYPRAPKRVNSGRNKTYYHVKDISFLQYEPVLDKFRKMKTFIKKHKRLLARGEKFEADKFAKKKPKIVLDHLVKERYPEFTDALRDMDDPMSMLYLFALLPSRLSVGHTPERVAKCVRLVREWETIISRIHALDKVFVSIKGIYYQATIQGQQIVWLAPHQFKQHLPDDVDYRVMCTFLDFYETLATFVNYKLFHDEGFHYPPRLDEHKEASRYGISAVEMQTLQDKARETAAVTSQRRPVDDDMNEDEESDEEEDDEDEDEEGDEEEAAAKPIKSQKALQQQVTAVVSKLGASSTRKEEEQEGKEDETNIDDFSKLDPSAPVPSLGELPNQFFRGLKFLLGREVPANALEFVILSGSGEVFRENLLTDAEKNDNSFTHQICDRRSVKNRINTREYVQPQWVFDSFNCKTCLPVLPYAPGVKPPPHLSPFVDDEAEGYVPKQRQVLDKWMAKPMQAKVQKQEEEGDEEEEEEEERERKETDAMETKYRSELEKERSGVKYSANKDGSDDDEEDEDEDEDEEEEEEKKETEKEKRKRLKKKQEHEMAVGMMTQKKQRLYNKMQYGINKKNSANAKLMTKRKALEKSSASKKRKASSKRPKTKKKAKTSSD